MNPIFPILPEIIQRPPEWLTSFFSKFMLSNEVLKPFYETYPYNEERFAILIDWMKREVYHFGCFTGAGISKPYAYPTWYEFLCNASKQMDAMDLTAEALGKGKYPEVAQLLEDLDNDLFEEIIRSTFSHRHIKNELCGVGSMLPFLPFKYVATTNFDFVVEGIYQNAGINLKPIIYGANPYKVGIATLEDLMPLLKIHGEYLYDRILTANQYQQHYSADSPLAHHLVDLFSSIPFVFIGFSLQDEDIQKALRQAKQKENPISHFALLPTNGKDDAFIRDPFFLELGVYPLWYPGSDHSYAETILGALVQFVRPNKDLFEVACALKFGNFKDALEASERLVLERPQCHVFRMAYAYCLASAIDWDEKLLDRDYINMAIAKIDRAIGSVNKFAEAYAIRAMMNYFRYSMKEVIDDLTQAITLGSSIKELLIGQRGLYRFMFTRDRNGAREDLALAVDSIPPEMDRDGLVGMFRFYIAFIDLKNGEENAISLLKTALDDPTFEREEMRPTGRQIKWMLRLVAPIYKYKFFRKWMVASMRSRSFAPSFMLWAGRAGIISYFLKRQQRREAKRKKNAKVN